ncbi:MAG: GNAT family N-acetyltransferase [Scytonematopsis contorta HA4267-MV1]|nr:GNAT family N-acetyltransferase [Scytonematopsis contorta HA4267-MV1]
MGKLIVVKNHNVETGYVASLSLSLSLLVKDESQTLGGCSLWWGNTPSLPGHRLGFIGHYNVHHKEAATCLLKHACQELASQGCTMVIAPVDGSTWQNYRLLTERGDYPVFFLEPNNPDDWQQHFTDEGFTPIAHYSSSLNKDLTQVDSRLLRVRERLEKTGVSIRSVNLQDFEKELQRIYTVALESFHNNFLFSPIDEAEFIAQYFPLLPYVQPELVLIAEHEDNPVGFIFAIPDYLEKEREKNIKTIIIKTVAILPGRIYAGLGNLLVAQCQDIARELGYSQAIHALMHDDNPSLNLSGHYAQRIRRYAVFGKKLLVSEL